MRTRVVPLLTVALLLGALLPGEVLARRVTVLGSLTVTKADLSALTTEVTGIAVISNPGFEKTMAQQLPPFVIPVFADKETDNPGQGSLDTLVALTNTTDSALALLLTLRNAAGTVLSATPLALPARGTAALFVSDLVP